VTNELVALGQSVNMSRFQVLSDTQSGDPLQPAWLREQGSSDIAKARSYALLVGLEQHRSVDVEKVPSGAATPRRVQEDLELPH
jgi:hypothetical protein